MEAFGPAPYYGWNSSRFSKMPTGTWSAYEGTGLSQVGGNAQITNQQKEFIQLPTVFTGIEYKVKYIINYNGNYERKFNDTNSSKQSTYKNTLRGIRARFVNAL